MKNRVVFQLLGIFIISFYGFLSAINAAPGDLDTTFGTTGFVTASSDLDSIDDVWGTALQTDGKIVAVGVVSYGSDFPVCAVTRYNPDGSPDTSFDGDGKLIAQIGVEFNCNDVAIQADGKIVVAGYIHYDSNYDFTLLRYNADGSPDTTFDGDGKVLTHFLISERILAVAIQTDGKIVAAGFNAVVRYNSNGSLDTSFDLDGSAWNDFFSEGSRDIVIQPDGKILVGGNRPATTSSSINDFAVIRYNPDGSPDTSFDGDGEITTDILGGHDFLTGLALLPDGKIVAGGSAVAPNGVQVFAVVRYNANGSLDISFDSDGKVTSDIANSYDILQDLAVQPDGKIVAAGTGFQSGNKIEIVRYNVNGSLDTSFDGDGSILLNVTSDGSVGRALFLQNDGKIVVSGATPADFALVRLNTNGSFDASFDVDGKVTTNIRKVARSARAVAIQPDGKIVAVGNDYLIGRYFVVYRYNADGTPDISFDGDGQVTTDLETSFDIARAVAVQPDGKILVAGNAHQALVLVRYNPDGSLDTSFSGDGKIFEGGQGESYFSAVIVQPDGKIIAAGRNSFIGYNCDIYRYNADGTRDNSFDGDGRIMLNLAGDDGINSIALQSDGKIVFGGKAQNGASSDFLLGRFNADGALDPSFDGDGVAMFDFVGGEDYVKSIAVQADGKIVAVGASSINNSGVASTYDSALVRVNPDGTPDSSFDGDGKLREVVSNFFDIVTGVVIQTDGKIMTSGYAKLMLNNDLVTLENNIVLSRYNSNGSPDASYANNGKVIVDLFTNDTANGIALDSSGRTVVAGETDGMLMVARFLGGGTSAPVSDSPYDFDGDGLTDISIFRSSNGQWWYSRSSDNHVLAAQFGNSTDKIVPADYTGDGKTDIAIWRESTGEWFILRSEDGSFYGVPFGTAGDIPAPADFDADGKADLAIFRPSSATWFISKSSGGTDIVNFGVTGDVPTVGDYDGDGKADIAIYRASTGEWWLKRSTAGVIAAQFGTSSDKPVQGDYSGDGKTDIAFYRPSTGAWFILRSENGSFYSVPFGASGDIPTPGDYDGDGKFDTAVFRPSDSTWYINRSTSGLLIATFGVAGDKPVPSAFVP